MDLRASVASATKSIASGDARGALRVLLDAWREHRAAAIAATLERLTAEALPREAPDLESAVEDDLEIPRAIDRLRELNAAAANGVIAKIRVKDDPRVAAALVRFLEDPAWHATGSQPFWGKVFKLLNENIDPRSLPKLERIDYATIINGKSMRGWMEERLAQSVAAIKKSGLTSKTISRVDRAALDALKAKPSDKSPKVSSKRADEAALFDAVYQDPDDDGPRAVLADFLIERGDPRGELITLMLSRTKEGEKRALAIIRKNQKSWLGAIAPWVKYVAYPSVDPVDPERISLWWNRGFLAGGIIAITKPKLAELAGSPLWSTLERVSSLRFEPKDGVDDALVRFFDRARALRSLIRTTGHTVLMASRSQRAVSRLERVHAYVADDALEPVATALASFSKLREVELQVSFDAKPSLMPLLASKLVDHVPDLTFASGANEVRFERQGQGSKVTFTEPNAKTVELAKELTLAKHKVTSVAFIKGKRAMMDRVSEALNAGGREVPIERPRQPAI